MRQMAISILNTNADHHVNIFFGPMRLLPVIGADTSISLLYSQLLGRSCCGFSCSQEVLHTYNQSNNIFTIQWLDTV